MTVDEKLVRDSSVGRKSSSEAENRKQFVAVVLLHDLADRLDSKFVLV
jgi:hypothetical protein